ncbi:hypothetical protein [Geodermatophilus ruber]|uniref:PknH-like extracellular domain-containing protein n=1 Tax=Geodermatophilus ruber TaxID=504800 RepID=A0A1I4EZS9_9ACTN|nr:hypothetical protein [Geodermatophilus ruber]SFL10056.1 hypothetical protein SAMN04488085_106227 [Geodermatophilus ruber]
MTGSSRSRRAALLAAGITAGAVLSGCAQGSDEAASPGSESSTAPASSVDEGTDLAPGLLPADAFGPDAQVTPLTEQQLRQGATAAGGSLEDAQITPEACAAAVQGTQPQIDEFEDLAAQVAVRGTTTTVELLSLGGPVEDAVSSLAEQIAACPEAQVSAPQVGTATISFGELDVPDLGDGSAGVSFTTVASAPDGTQVTVPALIGLVRDGDRMVTLLSTDPQGGQLDPAAFTGLLEQAYQAQAEALD